MLLPAGKKMKTRDRCCLIASVSVASIGVGRGRGGGGGARGDLGGGGVGPPL